MTAFASCKKQSISGIKSTYGEATINNHTLFHYITLGEVFTPKFYYLPFGGINNDIIVKDNICYLQLFLREKGEEDNDNFYLILIGCNADEDFPSIGKEYKIAASKQIDLGSVYHSFYETEKLRDYYTANPEAHPCGVAGLAVPFSYEFIPLAGTMIFSKANTNTGECTITFAFNSETNPSEKEYTIQGKFNGQFIYK